MLLWQNKFCVDIRKYVRYNRELQEHMFSMMKCHELTVN